MKHRPKQVPNMGVDLYSCKQLKTVYKTDCVQMTSAEGKAELSVSKKQRPHMRRCYAVPTCVKAREEWGDEASVCPGNQNNI